MTGVTICPECQKQVIVPSGTRASAQVECPLCNHPFGLNDAIPEDAPVLRVIDPGIDPESESLAFGAVEDERGDSDVDHASSSGLDFEDLTDEPTGAVPIFEADSEDEPTAGDDFAFATGAAEGSAAAGSAAEYSGADNRASLAGLGEGSASETATATTNRKSQPATKKKAKKLGLKAQMVGIVGFGLIGLALGYGILHFFFPENAKQIRESFGIRLGPLGALLSSDDDGGAGASKQDEDDFPIGTSLPKDQQPTQDEVKDVKGLAGSADGDRQDDVKRVDNDNGLQKRFTQLLNGQPDVAGVLQSVDAATVADAVAAARTLAAEDDGQITGKLYLGLCALGDKLAFAEKDAGGAAELSRTEAADLMRRVGKWKSQARLSQYSVDMLYSEKRPKDKNGIFLVGVTQIIKPYGEMFATEVEITRTDRKTGQKTAKRVVVLSEKRPDMTLHEPVGVLGSIVRDPAAKLPGYDPYGSELERFESDDTLIVLAGVVTLLPEKK